MPNGKTGSPIDIELRLLVEAIYLQYSHDFRDYARTHDLSEVDAVREGMDEKSREFRKGGALYVPVAGTVADGGRG